MFLQYRYVYMYMHNHFSSLMRNRMHFYSIILAGVYMIFTHIHINAPMNIYRYICIYVLYEYMYITTSTYNGIRNFFKFKVYNTYRTILINSFLFGVVMTVPDTFLFVNLERDFGASRTYSGIYIRMYIRLCVCICISIIVMI